MCAIVPCTPVVLTLPLTEPSSAIVKFPEPAADEDTGGTSSPPESLTPTDLPLEDMPAQAASANETSTTESHFMRTSSFWGSLANTAVARLFRMLEQDYRGAADMEYSPAAPVRRAGPLQE
jgi:hypothetical protein